MTAGMPSMAGSSEKKEDKTAAAGEALPEMFLDGIPEVWLQGDPVKKWEKDKVYIFEFWATWCGPCLAAMPHMEHLHQVLKENPNLQIIGVNVMDRKSPENLKEFLKNRPTPLTYTMAVDVDGKRTKAKWLDPLEVNGIPHVFAIKNGKLIWRGHPLKLSEEMLTAMLKPDFSVGLPAGRNSGCERQGKQDFPADEADGQPACPKKWQTGSCSPFKADSGIESIFTGQADLFENHTFQCSAATGKI